MTQLPLLGSTQEDFVNVFHRWNAYLDAAALDQIAQESEWNLL